MGSEYGGGPSGNQSWLFGLQTQVFRERQMCHWRQPTMTYRHARQPGRVWQTTTRSLHENTHTHIHTATCFYALIIILLREVSFSAWEPFSFHLLIEIFILWNDACDVFIWKKYVLNVLKVLKTFFSNQHCSMGDGVLPWLQLFLSFYFWNMCFCLIMLTGFKWVGLH